MEAEVNMNARRFNELKILGDQKEKELTKKREQLVAWREKEGAAAARRGAAEAKKAGHEGDLEAVQAAIAQRLHYRRVLDHMLRRLQANEITFDAHINAMEHALNGARKEAGEVRLLARQVEAGKNRAVVEAQEVHRQVTFENRERLKLLEGKERALRVAQEVEGSRAESWRRTLRLLDQKDLSDREEARLRKQCAAQRERIAALRREREEQEALARSLGGWFQQVKQKTGVLTPGEMVHKFMGQHANRVALGVEKQQADRRLERAKARRRELEARLAEVKASGTVKDEVTREQQEALARAAGRRRAALKAARAAAERLGGVLRALHQGAQGLHRRLLPYGAALVSQEEVALTLVQSTMLGLATEDNLALRNLHLSELALSKMIEAVGGGEGAAAAAGAAGSAGSVEGDATTGGPGGGGLFGASAKNLDDSWLSAGTTGGGGSAGGGGGAGLGGLQLSPHNVRVPSLRARNRPPPSPRAAAPAADRHQREYFSDSDSDTEGQRGAGAEVFDRATHKLLSVGEAQRKQEQEVKRKRAAERAERLAMADDKERAALTSVAAKVKAQTDSTQRLVKFRSPPGMPEGVTLRDDPMTKTQAFLTQDPELL